MSGKKEQVSRSNHRSHGRHPKGFVEARVDAELNREEKINTLQSRLGNRVVNQLLDALSSHSPTSTMVYRQSTAASELPLQKGSRGAAVRQVQQALLQAGYKLGKFGADGIFGNVTGRAVRRFQHAHHLPVTKIVDTQTWNVLVQAPPSQTPATAPGTTATPGPVEDGGLPRVDLGPKQKGRAYMLDWDSKHKEISQNTTLREAFLANLAIQLVSVFGEAVTQEDVLKRIEAAEAAGKVDEADKIRIKLRIASQLAVVETLKVSDKDKASERYKVWTREEDGTKKTSTYCNIYAYDVVTAMGGYLPRVWWKDKALARIRKGEKVKPIYEDTVTELSANGLTEWMYKFGGEFGWRKEEDITAAQDAANQGKLIILLAANVNPRASGHVSVLMPESKQMQAVRENDKVVGVVQSQAGGKNFKLDNHRLQWWKDHKHKLGAAWIFEGKPNSPLLSPETFGNQKK